MAYEGCTSTIDTVKSMVVIQKTLFEFFTYLFNAILFESKSYIINNRLFILGF